MGTNQRTHAQPCAALTLTVLCGSGQPLARAQPGAAAGSEPSPFLAAPVTMTLPGSVAYAHPLSHSHRLPTAPFPLDSLRMRATCSALASQATARRFRPTPVPSTAATISRVLSGNSQTTLAAGAVGVGEGPASSHLSNRRTGSAGSELHHPHRPHRQLLRRLLVVAMLGTCRMLLRLQLTSHW